jgi:hypothetical protein
MMNPPVRVTAKIAAVLCLGLAAPAVAQEAQATGGAEAALDRPALTVRPAALLDRTLSIRGRTDAGDAGRAVRIEVVAGLPAWREVASTVVGPDGTFSAAWRADSPGRVTVRAIVDRPAGSAVAASNPLVAQTTIFRPATASWYGPGFFGRRTACGGRLTRRTLGVAHKTLPCGTDVQLYHRGKTITVPVIDRGPFHPGREWDLTHATARALGMSATSTVGALAPEPTTFRKRKRR